MRIESDGAGELDEFDHVDPALPCLDVLDVRLGAPQLDGELDLSEPRIFPRLNEKSAQRLMPR